MSNQQSNEFMVLSDQIFEQLNDVNKSLVLANDKINDDIFLSLDNSNNKKISDYMLAVDNGMKNIFKKFSHLVSFGNKALASINDNISEVKNEVHDEINKIVESNNENYDYTQQLIEAQSSQIRQLEETIKRLNKTIDNLTNLIKPQHITLDHVENARYLIENTKNSSGKSIKGLAITIQNVSAILEQYDKLKAIN